MKKFDYHDASIFKIEHRVKENTLIIGILQDANTIDLIFEDIIGWDFSAFAYQNFLLDLKTYAHNDVPQVMRLKKAFLFELNPASGMGGYIIAQIMRHG
ncbi:hypothetical protein [Ohtaekwangia koreensis]|uniref:Uncharacterized protein n=1 Tax=Ohtaekwangia koreensis TaxID=688867 RepID=A0A1T5MIC5_9BACT|nr:hypothetical protein [Ohtaekwangia koreensis]SKC87639.1 hypothetical protein SAMN05660236_5475 [Ohtaekwangia koreensis]